MKITLVLYILLFANLALASWVTTYQDLSADIGKYHNLVEVHDPHALVSASSLEKLEKSYGNTDLKEIYMSFSEDTIEQNNSNIKNLLETTNPKQKPEFFEDKKFLLSRNDVRKIFRNTSNIYVVKREEKFDRDEVIGFCFGRAFISHHISHLRGVHPESIKKIWVVGDMKKWAHHVATILRTSRGWMAVDTYTGLLSVERWIKRMERDKKRNARELMFFVTNATRFGHESNNFYNSIDLFNVPEEELEEYESKKSTSDIKDNDFYKGYFLDFFRELDRKLDSFKILD